MSEKQDCDTCANKGGSDECLGCYEDDDDQAVFPHWRSSTATTAPPPTEGRTRGEADVLAERRRQREKYDSNHDDAYPGGTLSRAGAQLVHPLAFRPSQPAWVYELAKKGQRERLVIAAALVIAEIDKLDREELRSGEPQKEDQAGLLQSEFLKGLLGCSFEYLPDRDMPAVAEAAAEVIKDKLQGEVPQTYECTCGFMMGESERVADFCRVHGGDDLPMGAVRRSVRRPFECTNESLLRKAMDLYRQTPFQPAKECLTCRGTGCLKGMGKPRGCSEGFCDNCNVVLESCHACGGKGYRRDDDGKGQG